MAVATASSSAQPRAHHRGAPDAQAAATSAATVAMANGTRYSTLGAWSHWLAAISEMPAVTAHHAH
jgi:hypothetical protein